MIKIIHKIFNIKDALAHCDIPCGIYTPEQALTAAKTVVKMVEKIQELVPPSPEEFMEGGAPEIKNKAQSLMRYVMVKEQHAELCKKELLILWTDYFKEEHLKMFPDLHQKFWKAAKLCSKNKREVNLEAAQELQKAVGEIAEMFAKAEEKK
ncbi:MAG: superoxide dismutase, Ni [Candidatus Spechtbacteria bacterium]|nr:superoxide dismutase, Ni [Candidatus Spechtbacteria bacterium]